TAPPPSAPPPLSLHDALPIFPARHPGGDLRFAPVVAALLRPVRPFLEDLGVRRLQAAAEHLLVQGDELGPVEGDEVVHLERLPRSEEHTSELQSPYDLVCRLL